MAKKSKTSKPKASKPKAIKWEVSKTKFSKIKKGEYFRFDGKRKVYVFQGGGPKRGYCYSPTDDIFSELTTKTDRVVEIGFDY